MALNLEDIHKLAHLSRMHIDDAQAETVRGQLNGFFQLVEQMQAVDTDGVEPLSHPIATIQALTQPLRADRATEPDRRQDYQQCAPATADGLYLVPKVIE
ncbi:MAG: Asp-tRNA(Asn)/Glu-tRNA(Gln) amidotransferase subunit GatC [Candidatus Protistobacter heckmanni]|nr:Asp-tRNA(Asn)/Glu-tRNA(Gln) amidotransferase subunit GatC [Candidatus Protistobacter heckmanni]